MTSDEELKSILKDNKTIAVYGMSATPGKAAHRVPLFMKTRKYTVIPINPKADKIAGLTVHRTLADVPDDIEILDVFRPSTETPDVVRQAIERHKAKGDIKVVWLQEGIASDEAKALAEEAGMTFVQNLCLMKEYRRLFPEG